MDGVGLRGRERGAMWLSSAVIAIVVTLQAPGRIVPETKLDVLIDPVSFLGRALTTWDPSAGFGRVQNQAVGYLFPMGAFTTVGHELAVPPWIVQRLWIAAVLVVSLWGAHRVARAVGVGSAAGRVVAALTYALAPATLSVAAFQSAGQLPYALAPWVLVPLLTASDGASPRRVAARSALWIAAMGGVNGASAFAVLPLVLIWFTTLQPGPARRRLGAWWLAAAAAATLWWVIPLAVSVRYGLRFTAFTEQSSLTTWTESGTEILRGTGNWLAFIQTEAGPWLPGGWALATDRLAIVGSVGLAAGGIWGIARSDAPGRRWLGPSLVVGVTIMGIGYSGAWGGPFDGVVQQLLDGVLVPFRNVHKFSAVVRLPLAIGLGHLVHLGAEALARPPAAEADEPAGTGRLSWRLLGAPALALVLLGLAVAPAARGQLTAPGSFADVPVAWRQAGAWLDAHGDGGRTLVVPGSAFGEYEWGRPLDEPISSIQGTDWAVRDLIPLGGNGSTRVLDAIDTAFSSDALPPGFVATLQRAGVRYLLVRNDLDLVRSGGPRPASVRRLLATAPEMEVVASFGPVRSDPGDDQRVAPSPGSAGTEAFRSIDIYEVPDPVDRAVAYPAARAAVTSGGPEALLDLEPTLTDGRAVVLAVDDGADDLPGPLLVATDTARRRDVRFGAIRNNATYTLTADERSPFGGAGPVDRWPAEAPRGLTSARVDGAAALTDSRRPGQSLRPEQQPYAAFDGDVTTAWGALGRVGEWVQVELDEPTEVGPVTVRIPETTGKRIGRVRVVTDQGQVTGEIGPDGAVTVDPPPGTTSRVRVVIDDVVGVATTATVGISEIEIGGVDITRPLVVPSPAPGGAEVVNLARDRTDRFSLARRDEQGYLDREFRWGGASEVGIHGTASAAVGDRLDALLASLLPDADPGSVAVTATSQLRGLPAFGPAAAVDGDPLTAWISEPEAGTPSITLSWDGAVQVDTIGIGVLSKATDPVSRVVVTVNGSSYERDLTGAGQVAIPPTITDALTISFPRDPSDEADARQVAVAEVSVPGLLGRTATTVDRSTPVTLGCGEGPPVTLDGRPIATRASTTAGALLDGSPVPWTACEPVALDAGTHRVTAVAGSLLVSTLVIEPSGGVAPAPAARSVSIDRWGDEDRTVRVGAGDEAILATTENANDGWAATLDGETLTPIRVDGWRQGWLVPAGEAGTVHLHYRPAATQRIGLVVGLLALIGLVAAAVVPPRQRQQGRQRVAAGGRRSVSWRRPGERSWSLPVGVTLVVAAGVGLGGPLVLMAVPLAFVPHRRRWLPIVAATATMGAGAVALVGPRVIVGGWTGTFSGPAQALAVIAVMAVAMCLLPDRTGRPEPPDAGDVASVDGSG